MLKKMLFGSLFEEKVEVTVSAAERRRATVINRLRKLGFEVEVLKNGDFEIIGEYRNYNQHFSKLLVKQEGEHVLVKDELGFTLDSFPRLLSMTQVCFVVDQVIAS